MRTLTQSELHKISSDIRGDMIPIQSIEFATHPDTGIPFVSKLTLWDEPIMLGTKAIAGFVNGLNGKLVGQVKIDSTPTNIVRFCATCRLRGVKPSGEDDSHKNLYMCYERGENVVPEFHCSKWEWEGKK